MGRGSPEDYYQDSHDLRTLEALLLDPLSSGAGQFRRAAFDEPSDSRVQSPLERALPGSVLLFDGLFLQRPELRRYWDYSIYLDADERLRQRRLKIALDGCPPDDAAAVAELVQVAIERGAPEDSRHVPCFADWWSRARRYVEGWRLYENQCDPAALANVVIDNNDFASPTVTAERGSGM